jgi:hypothetical protein
MITGEFNIFDTHMSCKLILLSSTLTIKSERRRLQGCMQVGQPPSSVWVARKWRLHCCSYLDTPDPHCVGQRAVPGPLGQPMVPWRITGSAYGGRVPAPGQQLAHLVATVIVALVSFATS